MSAARPWPRRCCGRRRWRPGGGRGRQCRHQRPRSRVTRPIRGRGPSRERAASSCPTAARASDPARGFPRFDLILAMTQGHLRALEGQAPPDGRARLRLFLDYAPEFGRRGPAPDPWYGGMAFALAAMDMIEAGIAELLADMTQAGRAWPGPAQEIVPEPAGPEPPGSWAGRCWRKHPCMAAASPA
ncbi:MAG: hypothetical protein U1E17_04680 [Geminicoccaceae bacterium]